MVPIGSVATFKDETAPYRVPRYNLYPAAEIMGAAAPGVASGTALERMAELAKLAAKIKHSEGPLILG